jgi:hypothetical protein
MKYTTLLRFYRIKYLFLDVAADEYWYPAESCRLEAERIFKWVTWLARNDETAAGALAKLR